MNYFHKLSSTAESNNKKNNSKIIIKDMINAKTETDKNNNNNPDNNKKMKSNLFDKSLWINSYILIIIIHLYACLYQIENIRMYTKVLLMPFLLKIYKNSTTEDNRSNLISIGLFFGFIGDTLLIFSDNSLLFLISGLISFLAGHVCYIIEMIKRTKKKNFIKKFWILLLLIIFISFNIFWQYKYYLRDGLIRGKMIVPGLIYLLILGLLNLFSFFYMICYFEKRKLLLVLGTLLFWVSDFTLARSLFYESNIYSSFIVMSTYISAQTLITYGLCKKEDFIII